MWHVLSACYKIYLCVCAARCLICVYVFHVYDVQMFMQSTGWSPAECWRPCRSGPEERPDTSGTQSSRDWTPMLSFRYQFLKTEHFRKPREWTKQSIRTESPALEERPPPGFALRQNNSSYQDVPFTARDRLTASYFSVTVSGLIFHCIVARRFFNPAMKICSRGELNAGLLGAKALQACSHMISNS